MGCVSSSVEGQLGTLINKDLAQEKKDSSQIKKILFLGSGGSGKSTVFKQLRSIHGKGYTEKDKKNYIKHVHGQIINEMKTAINVYIEYIHRVKQVESWKNLQSAPDDDDNKAAYDELSIYDDLKLNATLENMDAANTVLSYKYDRNQCKLDDDICSAINTLWNEGAIKEIYSMRNITKIETTSKYFWDKLQEIAADDYIPSQDDILYCRIKTTGLHEMTFDIQKDTFNIIDVGGQRSQRRKWIHCFEYVVAVIFITSLSCYDEVLHEDTQFNAMDDSIELFEQMINERALCNTSMILFLNKTDLFTEKYVNQQISLNKCPKFSDFVQEDNEWDMDTATNYVRTVFMKLNTNSKREIFTHLTSAIDTNNITKVFEDVQSIVISNSLVEAGIMDFDED